MTDYDDMSLDELRQLKESREKAKLTAELSKEDENQKRAELEAHDNEVAEKAVREYLEKNPPQPKITSTEETKIGNKKDSIYQEAFDNYLKRSKSDVPFYDYETSIMNGFEYSNSDDGCDTTITAWNKDDVFVNMVWHAMYCKADLLRIAVPGLEIGKGDGLTVQIRTIGKFGAPSELAACECASCASNTLSSYSLTLKQYNLETIICEKDVWQVGEIYRQKMIEALGLRWAQFFDATIYSELETASPGTTETLQSALSCSASVSGSCCTDSDFLNLYDAIQNVVATMREGAAPYSPDYLIVSPTVARILKSAQTPQVPAWASKEIVFDSDGRLIRAAGLQVIEYCGANSCATTSAEVMAIVIDSSRAVGAAFGQRPQLYEFFQSNCNSTRYDMWCFFACAELDTGAIAHIVNP